MAISVGDETLAGPHTASMIDRRVLLYPTRFGSAGTAGMDTTII